MSARRRYGYWTIDDNLCRELQPWVSSLGRIPTRAELTNARRLDILNAIAHRGGIVKVAETFGYPIAHERQIKPRWTEKELTRAVTSVAQQLGRMPLQQDLVARGSYDLVHAIRRFGGFEVVAQRLGLLYTGPRQWSDASLKSELDAISSELKRMPSQSELEARNRGDLVHAIRDRGGLARVAKMYGYRQLTPAEWGAARTIWTQERLKAELESFAAAEGGFMPTSTTLKDRGRSDIVSACRQFGGIQAVATRFGYRYKAHSERVSERLAKNQRRQRSKEEYELLAPILLPLGFRHQGLRSGGHTFDWAHREARVAVEYNGCVWHDHRVLKPNCPYPLLGFLDPAVQRARDERVRKTAATNDLTLVELWSCERPRWNHQLRPMIDAIHAQFPDGHPASEKWITNSVELEANLDPWVRRLGRMPFPRELRREKRRELFNAIIRQGGFRAVAAQLGYRYVAYAPRGYWTEEHLRAELDPWVERLGQMPTIDQLIKAGRSDLEGTIKKHGGSRAVAQRFDYRFDRDKPAGYWTDENLRAELDQWVARLGQMPTISQLAAEGRHDLVNAISAAGGMHKVAARCGYRLDRNKPKGYWTNEQLKVELDAWVVRLRQMPSIPQLLAVGRADIVNAIKKAGGMFATADRFGYRMERAKRAGYWTEERLKAELDVWVARLSQMPTQEQLLEAKRSDLVGAIRTGGGFRATAGRFGYRFDRDMPAGYWTDERLKIDLDRWFGLLRRMPTENELQAAKRFDLTAQIRKRGGYRRVAQDFGYKQDPSGQLNEETKAA